MSWITRRAFFRFFTAGLSAVFVLPQRLRGRAFQRLPQAPLVALGQSVLPAELGTEGKERVTLDFQQWLDDFRPEPELPSGWGSAEIPHGPPDPTQRWTRQLERLNESTLQREGVPFSVLSEEERLSLLRDAITEESLPLRNPADAEHVAVGLLAFFYRSPEATNLAYQAAIHRESCRDLSAAHERPAPLQPGG